MSVQIKPKTKIDEFDLNAVSDISTVISGVYADIYDNSSTYINDNIQYNIYKLLDDDNALVHRGLSANVARYIPLISSVYDTIDYKDLDNDKIPELELNKYEELSGNYNKKKYNLDYINNIICPDIMKNVYSAILAGTTVTSSNCVAGEQNLINRLDQLRYLKIYVDNTAERLFELKNILYNGYVNTPIATTYVNTTFGNISKNNVISAENVAKIFLINQSAEPVLNLNIRGIKVPYEINQLTNSWWIAKFPQYLLANNSDDLLSIECIECENINIDTRIKQSIDVLTSNDNHGSKLATTNLLKV